MDVETTRRAATKETIMFKHLPTPAAPGVQAITFCPEGVPGQGYREIVEYASAKATPRTLLAALRAVNIPNLSYSPMIAIDGRRVYARAIHNDVQGCHTVAAAKAYLESIDEPVAPKAVTQRTIVFDAHFDLEFGVGGASEIPSGTSGNNGDASVVLRNCGIHGRVSTKAVDAEIAEAAGNSEDALKAVIRKHYRADGRTLAAWDRAMNEDCAYNPWQD